MKNYTSKIVSLNYRLLLTLVLFSLLGCSFQDKKESKLSKSEKNKISNNVKTSQTIPKVSKSLSTIKTISNLSKNKEIQVIPNHFLNEKTIEKNKDKPEKNDEKQTVQK